MGLSFRVKSKGTEGHYNTVRVGILGSSVTCSCENFNQNFCSHIDAVLVAGERAMVHVDDMNIADKAEKKTKGKIVVPPDWAGSWRKNKRWRGIETSNVHKRRSPDSGKPFVCFTGTLPKKRKVLILEAEQSGWETTNSASPNIDVLVAENPNGSSNKLKTAKEAGVQVVSYEHWEILKESGIQ